MQKINQDEFARLQFKSRHYQGVPDPIISEIGKLELGEGFIVRNEEWSRKTKLSPAMAYFAKKYGIGLSVRSLADGSGHAVLRKR